VLDSHFKFSSDSKNVSAKKMKTLSKTLLILFVANILRLIPGCCECDESSIPFSFNKIDITNIDNSGDWAVITQSDSMKPEAVAFEVALFDSAGYYHLAQSFFSTNTGYSNATAMSCDCSYPLRAIQHLSSLKITSLYALNAQYSAQSDVTELFVAKLTNNSSTGSNLYIPLPALCNQTQGKNYYDSGVESFGLYLTVPVENSRAAFIISAKLSDNRILSDTTKVITILNR